MRQPRIRIRMFMAFVAVVALGLGAEATRRRWPHFRERAYYHTVMRDRHRSAMWATGFAGEANIVSFRTDDPEEIRKATLRGMVNAALHRETAAEHERKRQEYLSRWW
jgi:hypothetical protein